jgi:hypothetical protein
MDAGHPPPHGWHLPILFTASQDPINGPCFLTAIKAYSEQVGWKRHPLKGARAWITGEMMVR